MKNKINLTPLYEEQKKLDLLIAKNHNITYAKTRKDRLLSLLVEICEFANETRCFKYWSNKKPSSRDVTIEEYADALHFFLSLGIDIQTDFVIYSISSSDDTSLTEDFLVLASLYSEFVAKQDDETYQKAFKKFIDMSQKCGFSWSDVEKAYYQKLKENFKRQENNY